MLALGGSAFAAAQATNLELVASAKTVDNGVVWSVTSDNDTVKRVDEVSLYTNVNGIVVYNNGEAINFNNKPYLTPDGKIYLPLREMLERFQIIEPNDNSSLQYDNGLVKLELYQWQTDAAGGRVLHCFYQRQFNMTDNLVGAQMHNDVIYVPAEMLLGIAQMSAVEGSSMLDGLMILQYDQNGGEVLRMVSLPLLGESKMVNTAVFLPERFAVVTQFAQAWQQSDYQKMQSFCTKYVLESVGWQYADVMLGQARAVYAEQWAAEPNSLNLHVLIIRPDGQSGYSELVYAVSSGKVLAADYMGEDGNKIILQHSDDGTWETRYSHLSSIAVKAGNVVEAGQVIGYVGSTGKSTGAHLHLSILQNGQPLDPMSFFEQK
ncbi:MAG: M23 family metallopeptidase [Firmicutes bacterium]|nr:M23 family metallopeptidase [Bacillota bacterium]